MESGVISPDVVQFRYNFTSGSVCTVHFSSVAAGRQSLYCGQLVNSQRVAVSNLSMDCREFLAAGFRYHLLPGRPHTAVDYIPLTAKLLDFSVASSEEAVFLPVHLRGAAANSPPTWHTVSQRHLVVDQFSPVVLTTDMVSARDDVTREEDLLVSVVDPLPAESRGYVVHRRAPWRPVVAFWLGDVLAGAVAWRAAPGTISPVDLRLTVSDGQFERARHQLRLSIRVRRQSQQQAGGPRIIYNRGLSVIQGGQVCLGTDTLNVTHPGGSPGSGTSPGSLGRPVDVRGSLEGPVSVRVIRGGPRHGSISVAGHLTQSFQWRNVQHCEVLYQHNVHSFDDSDQIYLRLTDGRRSVRTRVMIRVLPGTVRATSLGLSMNEATEVRQQGYAQITTLQLNTTQSTTSHEDVIFTITLAPHQGQLLMMYRPMTRGQPVSRFTQFDLDQGHIWYHHLGRSSTLRDSFRFLLHLRTSLASGGDVEMKHEVIVRPHARDSPPRLVRSSPDVTVKETEVVVIGRDVLRFEDREQPSEDVIFLVTCRPYQLGSSLTQDAGHIAYHDDSTFTDKNSSVVPLRTFTQSMVDGDMVAYVPPLRDIGPHPVRVQFIYSVSDLHGNFDVDQTFNITVLPVNNQVDQTATTAAAAVNYLYTLLYRKKTVYSSANVALEQQKLK